VEDASRQRFLGSPTAHFKDVDAGAETRGRLDERPGQFSVVLGSYEQVIERCLRPRAEEHQSNPEVDRRCGGRDAEADADVVDGAWIQELSRRPPPR
jgi:hypothetical protein